MIEIASLTEADKGREVRYNLKNFKAHGYGKITSWNEHFIFVRYHLAVSAKGVRSPRYGDTSEATSPEDLEFTS